jgi:hypothetical protein
MSGFLICNIYIYIYIYMRKREKMKRKHLTEYDIPYGVMLLVLLVAYNQMSRVSKVDMSSLHLYCH